MNKEEINYEEIPFCQSCGMPLMNEDLLAREEDGSKNKDYCKYCYENGNFLTDISMEEMIEFCAPKVAETQDIDAEEAKKQMNQFFPELKRWKK